MDNVNTLVLGLLVFYKTVLILVLMDNVNTHNVIILPGNPLCLNPCFNG